MTLLEENDYKKNMMHYDATFYFNSRKMQILIQFDQLSHFVLI